MLGIIDITDLNLTVGHPNWTLPKIKYDHNFTKDSHVSPCDICHKAKQTRESFPFSDHQTAYIGELIHLDLWCPYKVVNKDGLRYFLTIVDDYTRPVWIYLIKTKDETERVLTAAYLTNMLPSSVLKGRKTDGSKWLWKIKYKSTVAKHVDTPLPKNATLNHIESNDDHLFVSVSNYQRLVGKLIYLTNTRPDIAYVVHCLRQFMHSPLNSHLDDALRVLRYLKGSLGSGIQINKNGNLKLRAYKSKKQSTLSKSSAEAEYRSMASATCEVIWLSNLLGDMGVKNLLPVVMYCENSFTLQIDANPVFFENSKHFKIDVHLVREKVTSGVIKTEKIHTTQQIADILTKDIDIEQHKVLCGQLGILDMFKGKNLKEGVKYIKFSCLKGLKLSSVDSCYLYKMEDQLVFIIFDPLSL
uniref:Ribonuclease H-like domain-containing protein n=1 Tax=Tanacetum cinerariifolium TaxID=118510 RepID=A0A699GUW1_TANCI|nr:ribonuclease H-like domain-containing protein [Tanacetum cinerariifolium]